MRAASRSSVVPLFNFLVPLSASVWRTYFSCAFLGGALYFLFEHRTNAELALLGGDQPVRVFGVAVWHVMQSFLTRDTGIIATTVSGRVLSAGISFASTVVFASYVYL